MKVGFSRKSGSSIEVQVWTELLGPQHEKDQGFRLAIQIQQWVKPAGLKALRGR